MSNDDAREPLIGDSGGARTPARRRLRLPGTLVVAPRGVLDRSTVRQLDAVLAAHREDQVVIDLSECVLADRGALDKIDPSRWGRTSAHTCVACSRRSGRQLMAAVGVGKRLAVFQSAKDALQLRVLADAGFGPGWEHLVATDERADHDA